MHLESTETLVVVRPVRAPLMCWHVVTHICAFLRSLFSNPVSLYQAVRLSLLSWYYLGSRSTFGRVFSRLSKSLSGPELANCPICKWLRERKRKATQIEVDPGRWLRAYQPKQRLLSRFRSKRWPANAPAFSVLMTIYNTPAELLRAAINSVCAQTYARWQLICVDNGSAASHVGPLLADTARLDPRIRVIRLSEKHGAGAAFSAGLREASGDYVCFLDHHDALEPQALHRFAETVLSDRPDLLYSDEVICGPELEDVLHVIARPQFSYDYYVSHPYFLHLVAVRASLAREIGRCDATMAMSPNVDFILRVLERAQTVSHVPDVLYRCRTATESFEQSRQGMGDDLTLSALRRHLDRIGCDATVRAVCANIHDVAFHSSDPVKVAIIIPTKNHAAMLRACVSSIERTVKPAMADIFIVDHQSDDSEAVRYLANLRPHYTIMSYHGDFRFSAMMNRAVRQLQPSYSHYLFLNNDVEAIEPGWLEHLLGLGCRKDVAVVGATLLYPDQTIQHAGVIIGLMGPAGHLSRFASLNQANGHRSHGYNANLLSNRDVCAVTGACLLFRADVFDELGGFDERLAVGFGDTDICLRARNAGYKILMDAHAVLIHHESRSRGKASHDPHPEDTRFFIARWHKVLRDGDPCFSPLLSLQTHCLALNPGARSPFAVRPRTVPIVLPARQASGMRRWQAAVRAPGYEELRHAC